MYSLLRWPLNHPEREESTVQIICALVDPKGRDVGKETVTLVNVSSVEQDLKGWTIVDKNGNDSTLDGKLQIGEVKWIWGSA